MAVGGGSTVHMEEEEEEAVDDTWWKVAAAATVVGEEALAELLINGDVLNMVCGTLWLRCRCRPTLGVISLANLQKERVVVRSRREVNGKE